MTATTRGLTNAGHPGYCVAGTGNIWEIGGVALLTCQVGTTAVLQDISV